MPLKAPPNIFGLICPYHQFPTKATWLVNLPKKKHHLENHTSSRCQQTGGPPTCNRNAKDKTTQVAARVMLKYAIVRDGLEAFDKPTIACPKENGHGERFPLTTWECSKLRGTGLFESKKSQESYESISWNLMVFLGLHIGHNFGFYLFGSGHFSPSCASRVGVDLVGFRTVMTFSELQWK